MKLTFTLLALAIILPSRAMQQTPQEEDVDVLQLAYDNQMRSTLHSCYLEQDIKIARLKKLIAAGPSEEGMKSALDDAFNNDNEEAALLLVNYGAPIHFDQNGRPANYFPLWHAAARGWVKICDHLIEKGANVNAAYDISRDTPPTALAVAAYNGRDTVVALLIARGANLQAKSHYKGYTALHCAILGAIARKDARKSSNRLSEAQTEDIRYKEVLNLLIERGIDQSARDNAGNTAYDLLPHYFWN